MLRRYLELAVSQCTKYQSREDWAREWYRCMEQLPPEYNSVLALPEVKGLLDYMVSAAWVCAEPARLSDLEEELQPSLDADHLRQWQSKVYDARLVLGRDAPRTWLVPGVSWEYSVATTFDATDAAVTDYLEGQRAVDFTRREATRGSAEYSIRVAGLDVGSLEVPSLGLERTLFRSIPGPAPAHSRPRFTAAELVSIYLDGPVEERTRRMVDVIRSRPYFEAEQRWQSEVDDMLEAMARGCLDELVDLGIGVTAVARLSDGPAGTEANGGPKRARGLQAVRYPRREADLERWYSIWSAAEPALRAGRSTKQAFLALQSERLEDLPQDPETFKDIVDWGKAGCPGLPGTTP